MIILIYFDKNLFHIPSFPSFIKTHQHSKQKKKDIHPYLPDKIVNYAWMLILKL